MLEKTIRSKILRYLNSLPQSDFVVSPPGTQTGESDIKGCIAGRYICVEVKVPGKKPRPSQRYRLNKLRKAGALVIVASSVDEVKGAIALERYGEIHSVASFTLRGKP